MASNPKLEVSPVPTRFHPSSHGVQLPPHHQPLLPISSLLIRHKAIETLSLGTRLSMSRHLLTHLMGIGGRHNPAHAATVMVITPIKAMAIRLSTLLVPRAQLTLPLSRQMDCLLDHRAPGLLQLTVVFRLTEVRKSLEMGHSICSSDRPPTSLRIRFLTSLARGRACLVRRQSGLAALRK